MGRLGGTMADEDVALGQVARLDAIEEVLDVVHVDFGFRLDDHGLGVAAERVEFVAAAIDPETSLGAAELLGGAGDAEHEGSFKGGSELGGVFEQDVDGVGRGATVFEVVNATGSLGGNGDVLAHEHVDDVEPVSEEVGDLAAAEIEGGAPVPILLGVPVAPFERAEEVGPSEVGGFGLESGGRLAQVIAIAVPPGAAEGDFAEFAGVYVFRLGLEVVLAGALLHADLADEIVGARRLDDHGPFFGFQGKGLLDVDILAGIEGVDGDGAMPVVGNADEGDIDFLDLEQLAVVVKGAGVGGGRVALGTVEVIAPDIAEGDDIDIAGFDKIAHVVAAAIAGADQAELQAFIGAKDAAVRSRRDGGAEEAPAVGGGTFIRW